VSLSDPALSEAIKGYEMSLMSLALRLVGREGAEVDDLMQEGRIVVWQALVRGLVPSMVLAYKRMISWVKYLRTQNPAPYEEMLSYEALENGR
jgi:DNA-directed RNA polymerase specialized sigma24 family protein